MRTFILRPLTLLVISLLFFGPIVYLTGLHSVLAGFNLRNYALLMGVYAVMSLAAAVVRKVPLVGRNTYAGFVLDEASAFFVSSIHLVTFLLAFNMWVNYKALAQVHEITTLSAQQHASNVAALAGFYLVLVFLAKITDMARRKMG